MTSCPVCEHDLIKHQWTVYEGGYHVAAPCIECGCRWLLEGTGWLDSWWEAWMVPEWIVGLPLNLTDLKVFIVLSAKASGRERIAWISQAAIAERIGMRRETVGRSIRRLIKHDVVQVKGGLCPLPSRHHLDDQG